MRSRKEMKIDGQSHYNGLEKRQDAKAAERFSRPAYQAGTLIKEQGKQLEHKTVAEYLAERYDIKGVSGSGRSSKDRAVAGEPEKEGLSEWL